MYIGNCELYKYIIIDRTNSNCSSKMKMYKYVVLIGLERKRDFVCQQRYFDCYLRETCCGLVIYPVRFHRRREHLQCFFILDWYFSSFSSILQLCDGSQHYGGRKRRSELTRPFSYNTFSYKGKLNHKS